MKASACQREAGVSCGACCGIFNLDLRAVGPDPQTARAQLLFDRTQAFAAVRYDQAADFVAYRRAREAAEESIPRYQSETYVCPFFGLIETAGEDPDGEDGAAVQSKPKAQSEGGVGRTGCLAHPARTGLEHTQNFSFYGASICQAYDCRNKDQDEKQNQQYSRLLARWFGSQRAPGSGASENYARLMADIPLYAFLEGFDGLFAALSACDDPSEPPLRDFLGLARLRLATPVSAGVTSFEVEMQRYADPLAELRALLAGDALTPEAATIVANFQRGGTGKSTC